MRPNGFHEDPMLALLRELRTYDVSAGRARRLRARCHTALAMQDTSRQPPRGSEHRGWRRAGRVLAGAWCVVYVFETIRLAAAVYGF